jgi:glycosyltransferase involved in cell wall biosynthesis
LRILYLVPYAPDPIRVRPYNFIRALKKRGHEITVATLWSSKKEHLYLSKLKSEGIQVIAAPLSRTRAAWNCLRTLPRPTPIQSAYSWQPELLQNVQSAIRQPGSSFDLIHVEHLRGARYGTHLASVLDPERKLSAGDSAPKIPMVWDSVDCISHLFEQSSRSSRGTLGRLVTRFELPRTRWYEAWLVGRFDRVLVTSELDRLAMCDLLQQVAPSFNGHVSAMENITVLGNGVDLEYFQPLGITRTPQTLILSGKMSYHANVTAALHLIDEIMPLVWERFPSTRVQIVGQSPPREIVDLARRYPGRASVTGTVTDLRPYLGQAALAVAPIVYGAGIQNKVLEAMAMATPVVATSKAISALGARNGEAVLVGDDPVSFSEQVIRILRNPAYAERLGRNGRRYVELNHDWNQIAGRLEAIYREVIAPPQHNA